MVVPGKSVNRRLTRLDSPEVKDLVHLHDRRGRRETGKMLLEGPHLLREALSVDHPLDRVYFLPEWAGSAEGTELLGLAERMGAILTEVPPRLLAKAATTDTPPPVLAVAAIPRGPVHRTASGLVLDGLQDPGNLGTILRTAWGSGVGAIWATPGTVDFYAPKVLRAAQGAHFHLSLQESARDTLPALIRREGWWLAAAEAEGGVPFWQAELRLPCLICIGNEARGIGADLYEAADERVSIPLARGVDSLNAAVSAGVILFELARRIAAAGLPLASR